MVKFTIDDLRRVMHKRDNIRNISIVSHVTHGKSTLTDSLVAAAGIISQKVVGDARMTDTRADEVDHRITTKSGHADFSAEVTAALRITDGALVVVDCVEGVCVQTQTVLHQALGERIKPVLTVNKMDRCFLELQLDGEEAYQTFSHVIENANVIMATYGDNILGDTQVYPEKGTVAFSAGLHGWAFTLSTFAKMYASKFGVDETRITSKFWGENFFDPETNKWTTKHTGSSTCKRGFVQFCYDPLKNIINTCMKGEKNEIWPMLEKLGVNIKADDKELSGKALMKRVMQSWIPASTALLEMMIFFFFRSRLACISLSRKSLGQHKFPKEKLGRQAEKQPKQTQEPQEPQPAAASRALKPLKPDVAQKEASSQILVNRTGAADDSP